MILLLAAATHAQFAAVAPNTPTSGAILTIKDLNNDILLDLYDSEIHNNHGFVGTVPLSPCTSADAVVQTDAYVLQGGSATGCQPPDSYEITDVAASSTTLSARPNDGTHQLAGSKDIAGFHIETHFVCVGKCARNVSSGNNKTFCNTSGTICINVVSGNPADDGFVVVQNTGNSNFTGTITLQGTSTTGCAASDSATFTNASPLLPFASVTLAMGALGTALDSSACGGFNYNQMQPLTNDPLHPAVFLYGIPGRDDFVVRCSDCNPGDVATFRPVPFPQDLFSVAAGSTVGLVPPQKCITFAEFSSPDVAHGVCPLFETHCLNNNPLYQKADGTCVDGERFTWSSSNDFIIDQNTIFSVISGVHLLGDPGVACAASLIYSEDIVLTYTGAVPGTDPPPLTGGSRGGLNCFVDTYDPMAAPIAPLQEVFAFKGFDPPNSPPPTINPENGGQNVNLPFFYANGAGGPGVTNLLWCEPGPVVPGSQVCADGITPPPFVSVKRTPFTCPGFPPGTTSSSDGFIGPATNSFMHNNGGGNYSINWGTSNTEPTTNNCFWLGVVFSSQQSNPFVDEYQFVKAQSSK
jgi:hypothetical protein